MAAGLDDLILFLLDKLGLSGENGVRFASLQPWITEFYESEENKIEIAARGSRPQNVDEHLCRAAWRWLKARDDVRSEQRKKAETATIDTAHKEKARQPKSSGRVNSKYMHGEVVLSRDDSSAHLPASSHTSEAERQKQFEQADKCTDDHDAAEDAETVEEVLFATEERIWHTLTGHGPDIKRVSPLQFALLPIIALRGSKGIPQPELVRLSGQDKRSLPKRTDDLARAGYIDKRGVLSDGSSTSLCTLMRFAPKAQDEELDVMELSPEETSKYLFPLGAFNTTRFLAAMLKIFKNADFQTMSYPNFCARMGVVAHRFERQKVLASLKQLEKYGWIKVGDTAGQPTKKSKHRKVRLIRLVHEPTAEEQDRFVREWRTDPFVWEPATEDNDMDDDENDLETEDGVVAQHAQEEQSLVKQESSSRSIQPWHPELPMQHAFFDVTYRAGTSGLSSMAAKAMLGFEFYVRTFEQLAGRLTDVWQYSQPPHLRHLGFVRDTALSHRSAHYQYFTHSSFADLVRQGQVNWTDLGNLPPDMRISEADEETGVSKNTHLNVDDWGFHRVNSQRFTASATEATPEDCQRYCSELKAQIPGQKPRKTGRKLFRNSLNRSRRLSTQHAEDSSMQRSLMPPPPLPAPRPVPATSIFDILNPPPQTQQSMKQCIKISLKAWEDFQTRMHEQAERVIGTEQSYRDMASSHSHALTDMHQALLVLSLPGAYIDPPQRMASMVRGRPRKSILIVIKSEHLKSLEWFTPSLNQDKLYDPGAWKRGEELTHSLPEAVESVKHLVDSGKFKNSFKRLRFGESRKRKEAPDAEASNEQVQDLSGASPGASHVTAKKRKSESSYVQSASVDDSSFASSTLMGSELCHENSQSLNMSLSNSGTPNTQAPQPLMQTQDIHDVPMTDDVFSGPQDFHGEFQESQRSERLHDREMQSPSSKLANQKPGNPLSEQISLSEITDRDTPAVEGTDSVTRDVGVRPLNSPRNRKSAMKKGGVLIGTGGGSLMRQRTDIIMNVVQSTGGVFPGNSEIWYAFVTAWRKIEGQQKTTPDHVTVGRAVKQLVDSHKLKKMFFAFETNGGVMTTRSILALPQMSPDDSVVTQMQSNIKKAHPSHFLPPEADIDPLLRNSARRRAKTDTFKPYDPSTTGLAAKSQSVFTPDEIAQLQSENASRSQGMEPAWLSWAVANDIDVPLRRPNDVVEENSDYLDSESDANEDINEDQAAMSSTFALTGYVHTVSRRKTNILRYKNALRGKRIPGIGSNVLSRQFSERLEDDSAQQQNSHSFSLTDPDQSYYPMNHTFSTDFSVTKHSDQWLAHGHDTQLPVDMDDLLTNYVSNQKFSDIRNAGFLDKVHAIASWEKKNAERITSTGQLSTPRFINHTLEDEIFDDSEGKGFRLDQNFDSLFFVSPERPSDNLPYAMPKRQQGASRYASVDRLSNNDAPYPSGKYMTPSTRYRSIAARANLSQADSGLLDSTNASGLTASSTQDRDDRSLGESQAASKKVIFSPAESQKLLISVVVAQCILGGQKHPLFWDVVCSATRNRFPKDRLVAEWTQQQQRKKEYIKTATKTFEELFLENYKLGNIPSIDYNNLMSYDWAQLLKWTNLRLSTSGSVSNGPLTEKKAVQFRKTGVKLANMSKKQSEVEEQRKIDQVYKNLTRDGLPADRQELESNYKIEADMADIFSKDLKMMDPNRQSSINQRNKLIHSFPRNLPMRMKSMPQKGRSPVENSTSPDLVFGEPATKGHDEVDKRESVVKSFARANLFASHDDRDQEKANIVLSAISPEDHEAALHQLKKDDKMALVKKKNAKKDTVGAYDVSEKFWSSFARSSLGANLNPPGEILQEATWTKRRLDEHFFGTSVDGSGHHTNKVNEWCPVQYHALDGSFLCLINLIARGELDIDVIMPPIVNESVSPKTKANTTSSDSTRQSNTTDGGDETILPQTTGGIHGAPETNNEAANAVVRQDRRLSVWGFPMHGYKTTHLSGANLVWPLRVRPTERYTLGIQSDQWHSVPAAMSSMPNMPPSPAFLANLNESLQISPLAVEPIPIWYDITGRPLPQLWTRMLHGTLSIVAIRSGITPRGIRSAMGRATAVTEMDINLVLKALASQSLIYQTRTGGWSAGPRWWTGLGESEKEKSERTVEELGTATAESHTGTITRDNENDVIMQDETGAGEKSTAQRPQDEGSTGQGLKLAMEKAMREKVMRQRHDSTRRGWDAWRR